MAKPTPMSESTGTKAPKGPEAKKPHGEKKAAPPSSPAQASGTSKSAPKASGPLVEAQDLTVHFPIHGGLFFRKVGNVYAVNGVSFTINPGETLGLVGESGCGKTTVGRALLRLYEPTAGKVLFEGKDLAHVGRNDLQTMRKQMQMVFQDPFESLNSRHTVGTILKQPFIVHGVGTVEDREKRVGELLERVGLPAAYANRFPHEFSGGQRQRIVIARAIALNPKLVVCDEPVSALDVSIQSQILNLLMELQSTLNLTFLFIAHNLAVVRHVSDRIAVMYLGRIVEFTTADRIYSTPMHPYTRALISAIPSVKPTARHERIVLKGDVPSPISPPSGCPFHVRCPHAKPLCSSELPPLRRVSSSQDGGDHFVACHFAGEI